MVEGVILAEEDDGFGTEGDHGDEFGGFRFEEEMFIFSDRQVHIYY